MKIVMAETIRATKEQINDFSQWATDTGHTLILHDSFVSAEEAVMRAANADILIWLNTALTKEMIAKMPKLKMISVAFTGVDKIDLEACKERGIMVCNAAGYGTEAVAELTMALMIAVLRQIVKNDQRTREHGDSPRALGNELNGRVVGIVGTGAIGLRVAALAKAFGCTVIAYSRSRKVISGTYVELDELLSKSDIVSLHVPLTDATKHLISRERIALMKLTAVLINTARGAVVDNDALAEALQQGKIAGAGIDVFDAEPPLQPGYKLLSAPNTVVTPHIGYATQEAIRRRADIAFENIKKYLAGNPQNRVA